MGQYEESLIRAVLWLSGHWIELVLLALLVGQGKLWHDSRGLTRRLNAPPPPVEKMRRQASVLVGNPILQQIVHRLRDAIERGPEAESEVARQQRRLGRNGIVPPKTVEECDALLEIRQGDVG